MDSTPLCVKRYLEKGVYGSPQSCQTFLLLELLLGHSAETKKDVVLQGKPLHSGSKREQKPEVQLTVVRMVQTQYK